MTQPLQVQQARPMPPISWKPVEENEKVAGYSFELKPRILTVQASERISASMVRIRFSADDGFAGFPFVCPTDHIKLFFDQTDAGQPVLPRLQDGRWSSRGLTFRDYTVRWFDAQQAYLDIDFVLHDHGVAGLWASRARVGDQLGALGPRGAFLIKDVFDWYVLGADETSLPALARWLEVLRPEVPVTAYIEVANRHSRISLPTRADLSLHWLDRQDSPAGESQLLPQAILNHSYPNRDGFVWVAGEAMTIKPIRRWIKNELKLERDHWDVDGYWRRGVSNHDHHTDQD